MKKLIFIPFLLILFVACDNKAKEQAEEHDRAIENSYITGNNISIFGFGIYSGTEYMPDIEGYEKFNSYAINYDVKGQNYSEFYPHSVFEVQIYKKEGKVAFFIFSNGIDNRFADKFRECQVTVIENKMTSEECGNKEGEVVNKILNAIENKTYFDY